jgi:hypothetical protein
VVKLSPYRLVTSRRGSLGLPFGWEFHDAAGAEISRSPVTFRSRYEAMAEGDSLQLAKLIGDIATGQVRT